MSKCLWRECTLGELIELQRGYDLPKISRQEGNYPIVSSSGITGFHSEAKAKAPGVVTGRYGTLGQVFYIQEDYWPLNTSLYVKDFKGNDPRYIAYLLESLNLGNSSSAAAVPGVNRNHLHELKVKAPNPLYQRRIASILSAYDDLIENNTRRIGILEEIPRRLYEEWFVHFRFPGHEQVRFKQTELGRIPGGWKATFPTHVDFLEGPGLRKWQYRETGIPFLNIRTLIKNDIDLDKVQFLDQSEVEERYNHFLLKPLDHVVSSSGTLGRTVTIQNSHLPLMLNTSIIRMRPRGKQVGIWLLKAFLLSPYFQDQINAVAIGAAQKNFGPSHLNEMWIIAPDTKTAQLYEEFVDPMEHQILALVRKNNNLRAQRDLLLHKLVSGELNVSDMPLPDFKEDKAA